MNTKLKSNTYENGVISALGKNSEAFGMHDFVVKTANVLSLAVAAGVISGIAMEAATMASDNETVDMVKVNYEEAKDSTVYKVEISGGTITAADEGKFYDLSDENTVDGTSESATTGQLKLVTYISATAGGFVIATIFTGFY